MSSGPLWMPAGSVRALIALAIVLGVFAALFKGTPVDAQIYTAFALVLGLYFSKDNASPTTTDSSVADELKILSAKIDSKTPVVVPTA